MAKDTEKTEKDFESSNYYNIGNLGGVAPNTRGKKYPGQAPGYYDPLAAGGVQVTRGGTYERPVLPMEDFGAFQRGLASTYKPPAQVEPPKWEELEFNWDNVRSDEDDFYRTADRTATAEDVENELVLKGDGTAYSIEEYNALDDETKNALKIKGKQYEIKAPAGLEDRVRKGIITDLEKQWNNCTEIDKRCRDVVLKHVAGVTSINTNLQTLVSLADADLNDINVSAKYLPGVDGEPNKDGLTFAQYARITNESPEDINYGTQENKYGETQYGIWVYDKKSKKRTFINTSAVNEQYAAKHYKIKYDQSSSIQQAMQKDGSMENLKGLLSRRNDFVRTNTTIKEGKHDPNLEIIFGGRKVKITSDTTKYIDPAYYSSGYDLHQAGAEKAFSTVNDPNFPSAWNQLMNKFREGKTVPNFGLIVDDDKRSSTFNQEIENSDRTASNKFLTPADFIQLKKELGGEYSDLTQEDFIDALRGTGFYKNKGPMDTKRWENVSKELMLKLVQDNWAEESKILNDNFGYVRDINTGRAVKRNDLQYKVDNNLVNIPQDIGLSSGSQLSMQEDYKSVIDNVLNLQNKTVLGGGVTGLPSINQIDFSGDISNVLANTATNELLVQGYRSTWNTLQPLFNKALPRDHTALYGEEAIKAKIKADFNKSFEYEDENALIKAVNDEYKSMTSGIENADIFIVDNSKVTTKYTAFDGGAESADSMRGIMNILKKYPSSSNERNALINAYNASETKKVEDKIYGVVKNLDFNKINLAVTRKLPIKICNLTIEEYTKKNKFSEVEATQLKYSILRNIALKNNPKNFMIGGKGVIPVSGN